MLTFQKVGYKVDKTEILKDLSFQIVPKEIVALIGSSGAGKSSIFKLLTGEIKPTHGEILLDEMVLSELSFNSIQLYRRQIGIVFQDFRLLPQKTVFENISFALEVCGERDLIKERVPELLELVGLSNRANSFPRELSGGEQQRVAIARALVHKPKILFADEPTGNLDPKNSREIAELLVKLNESQDLTILFATHDQALLMDLHPRIIRLEGGKIKFDLYDCPPADAFSGIF